MIRKLLDKLFKKDKKRQALKDYEDICVCNGKLQGAWCGDYYADEEITYLYEEHMLNVASDYDIPIPPIEDYGDEEYPHEYQKLEARATDVYWALQAKLEKIILG